MCVVGVGANVRDSSGSDDTDASHLLSYSSPADKIHMSNVKKKENFHNGATKTHEIVKKLKN
jgi:hypothetical protein